MTICILLIVHITSRLYENKEEMLSAAMAMASLIASKSPVAVTSTKHNLVYSRDHPVDEGLNYMVRIITSTSCSGDLCMY